MSISLRRIGSLVSINGTRTRVVGVMPPGFGFPVAQDAWMAMPAARGGDIPPGLEWVSLFGRLAPGVTPAQAAAEATTRLQRAVAERRRAAGTEGTAPVIGLVVESFPEAQFGENRALLFLALNAAAWLILLLSLVCYLSYMLSLHVWLTVCEPRPRPLDGRNWRNCSLAPCLCSLCDCGACSHRHHGYGDRATSQPVVCHK